MYKSGVEGPSSLQVSRRKMKCHITNVLTDFFFEYETPRQVLVRNRRVGVVCRLIQLGVLGYIIGWVFIYEKGYQSTDTAISSVYTKMKGVGYTKVDGIERVWDVVDYVFPPQGDSSFVVMTNYIITEGQKMGKCAELPGRHDCSSNADCEEGAFQRKGRGPMTGVCLNDTHTCEVVAWCPIEDDGNIPDPPRLMSVENYTLFIKNSVTFPLFGVTRSNLEGIDYAYINKCVYDPVKHPLCPILRLGDIVKLSDFNFTTLAKLGGAIGIVIDWTCNLDLDVTHCKPQYSFHGLYGNPGVTDTSVGYNFRYGKYYMEDKQERRTLLKVFGIRIDIIVHSLARKFDIIPTLTAIGSGVGIFGVATVVCDLVLLHLLPKREFYKNMKFKYTETQEIDEEGCNE